VWNLSDGEGGLTFSVNHNWMNAHCLWRVWLFLKNELVLARAAIAHERDSMGEDDWHSHCAVGMSVYMHSSYSFQQYQLLLLLILLYLMLAEHTAKVMWHVALRHWQQSRECTALLHTKQ
jgi:hypothetical protein